MSPNLKDVTARMNAVTLRRLRIDAPDWDWEAERHGFGGYQYRGTCGDRKVVVSPFAVNSGPCEDDYTTQWRVDDGETSTVYIHWLLAEGP